MMVWRGAGSHLDYILCAETVAGVGVGRWPHPRRIHPPHSAPKLHNSALDDISREFPQYPVKAFIEAFILLKAPTRIFITKLCQTGGLDTLSPMVLNVCIALCLHIQHSVVKTFAKFHL